MSHLSAISKSSIATFCKNEGWRTLLREGPAGAGGPPPVVVPTSAVNAQCAYGSEYRKFTRLLGAMVCRPALDALASRMCTCKKKHKKVAKGRDAFGRSLSAVYPTPYNTMLALRAKDDRFDPKARSSTREMIDFS